MTNQKHWLSLSILFTVYFTVVSIFHSFSQNYIIQDDARIHIVWLERFSNSALFPNDWLANYFIYFAPLGFKSVYWLGAKLGIEPIVLGKILPSALGLITTIYTYYLSLQIIPKPFCAFLSSLFITQLIWCNDDLISATPRAFVYPLFAAFLYYLAAEKLLYCLVTMFCMGLFYPQVLLVEMSVIGLRLLEKKGQYLFWFVNHKKAYQWFVAALIITAIALIPFTLRSPEWSNVVTASDMKQLPEFNRYGRSYFFGVNWLNFALAGDSGLSLPIFPPIVWSGLFLPFWFYKSKSLKNSVTPKIDVLLQVVIASLFMFFVAHFLLLKIHLPNRYTYHSLRFILAISSAIICDRIIQKSISWLRSKNSFSFIERIRILLATLFAINAIVFPAIPYVITYWCQNWRIGENPAIYQYLASQPENTLTASLSTDANNIPAFSRRSILVGEEFAFAYHPYYYQEFQQRAKDLIKAQYSTEKNTLISFVDKYQIDYFMLDKAAFDTTYLLDKNWLIYSSWQDTTKNAIAKLRANHSFVLPPLIKTCSVVTTKQANLLDTICLQKYLMS